MRIDRRLGHGVFPTTCASCRVSMPNTIRPTAALFGGVLLSAPASGVTGLE
jgi:hypothetical protein